MIILAFSLLLIPKLLILAEIPQQRAGYHLVCNIGVPTKKWLYKVINVDLNVNNTYDTTHYRGTNKID
jgi:hypothetical protein